MCDYAELELRGAPSFVSVDANGLISFEPVAGHLGKYTFDVV